MCTCLAGNKASFYHSLFFHWTAFFCSRPPFELWPYPCLPEGGVWVCFVLHRQAFSHTSSMASVQNTAFWAKYLNNCLTNCGAIWCRYWWSLENESECFCWTALFSATNRSKLCLSSTKVDGEFLEIMLDGMLTCQYDIVWFVFTIRMTAHANNS